MTMRDSEVGQHRLKEYDTARLCNLPPNLTTIFGRIDYRFWEFCTDRRWAPHIKKFQLGTILCVARYDSLCCKSAGTLINVWRPPLSGIRIYGRALNALPFTTINSNDELDS